MAPMQFLVSVITPVYNAEETVRRAVESAVHLEDVGEILLIDDAGPDNAIEVCRELATKYPKIRLLSHADGKNHGAGASRNLGIEMASCPYIAFLDADDYYLPNRFTRDREILVADETIDGVYGGTGIDYEDEAARERFHAAGYSYQEFTSLSAPVSSEDLFAVMFHQHPIVSGELHTDAITLRKSLLDKVGTFHIGLRLQQDTHLWRRLAAAGSLVSGIIDQPIAIRGVHARNRMTDQIEQEKFRALWWESLIREFHHLGISRERWHMVRRSYAGYLARRGRKTHAFFALLRCVLDRPNLVFASYGYFDLTFLEIYNRNRLSMIILSVKNRFIRKLVCVRGYKRNRMNNVRTCYKNLKDLFYRLIRNRLIAPNLVFSIISDDCWGSAIYKRTGHSFNSPFIGLWVACDTYLGLLENLKSNLAQDLVFIDESNYPYPVAMLGTTKIGFMHYSGPVEARLAFERRLKRMRYDKFHVKVDFRYPWYDANDIKRWNALALHNSIALVEAGTPIADSEIHNKLIVGKRCKFVQDVDDSLENFWLPSWLKHGELVEPNSFQKWLNRFLYAPR